MEQFFGEEASRQSSIADALAFAPNVAGQAQIFKENLRGYFCRSRHCTYAGRHRRFKANFFDFSRILPNATR